MDLVLSDTPSPDGLSQIAAISTALGLRTPSVAGMDREQANTWIRERWTEFMAQE